MKKLLSILTLLICTVAAHAQWAETFNYGIKPERVWIKKLFKPPIGDTAAYDPVEGGMMIGNDIKLYIAHNGKWTVITGGTDTLSGSGLTFPQTPKKYVSGYGWATLNTDSLNEGGTNKFYTDARARGAFSITTQGNEIPNYAASIGVFNVPLGWNLLGNHGMVDTNFLGTTDSVSLRFRVNNIPYGFLGAAYNTAGNMALGYRSLSQRTTGNANTGLGDWSLWQNRTGGSNTAVGYTALNSDTTGSFNTGVGSRALRNAVGDRNTAIGAQSGEGITTGGNNTFVGENARVDSNGSWNVQIGNRAGMNANGDSNILIGAGAGYSSRGSQRLIIDNKQSGTPFIWGNMNPSKPYLSINGGAPTSDTVPVLLDLVSTNRGVLFPRMNTAQMKAIKGAPTGMILWQTDSLEFFKKMPGHDTNFVRVGGSGGNSTITGLAEVIAGKYMTGGGASGSVTVGVDSAKLFNDIPKNRFGREFNKTDANLVFDFKSNDLYLDSLNNNSIVSRTKQYPNKFSFLYQSPVLYKLGRETPTAESTVQSSNDSTITLHAQSTAGDGFRHDVNVNAKYVQILRDLSPTAPVKFRLKTDSAKYNPKRAAFFEGDTLKYGLAASGGGGGVDSLKPVAPDTLRVYSTLNGNQNIILETDSLVAIGDLTGKGTDTIPFRLAATIPTSVNFTGKMKFGGGIQTNPNSAVQSNLYVGSDSITQINTQTHWPNTLPSSITSISARVTLGAGTTTGTIVQNSIYSGINIAEAPITINPASTRQPWITQLLANNFGPITNTGNVPVNIKANIIIPKTVASSFADTSAGLVNYGHTYLNGDVFIPTTDTAQNNNRAASTKWVKDLLKGFTSNNPITFNNVGNTPNTAGAAVTGSAITLQPADSVNGVNYPGIIRLGNQTFGGGQKAFTYPTEHQDGLYTGFRKQDANLWVNHGSSISGAFSYPKYMFPTGVLSRGAVMIGSGTKLTLSDGENATQFLIGKDTVVIPATGTVYRKNQAAILTPIIQSNGGTLVETNLLYLGDSAFATTTNGNYILHGGVGRSLLEGSLEVRGNFTSPNVVKLNQANRYDSGQKQLFVSSKDISGFRLAPQSNIATDPTQVIFGDMWLNAGQNRMKYADFNGAIRSYVNEDQPQTLTYKTLGTGTALAAGAEGSLFYKDANGLLAAIPAGTAKQKLTGGLTPTWRDTVAFNLTATNNFGQAWTVTNPTTAPNISLILDTTKFSTRLWRQKGIDSVAALLANKANTNTANTFTTGTQTFANDIVIGKLTAGTKGDSSNTLFGHLAGNVLQATAHNNSFFGHWSGKGTTTGSMNTASGSHTLLNNTSGTGNTATGNNALISNTTGNYNTAIGDLSQQLNTFGGANTSVGESSLTNNNGSYNVAIGYKSGFNNQGSNNTLIGSTQPMLPYNVSNASNYDNTIFIGGKSATDSAVSTTSLVGINTMQLYSTLTINGSFATAYRIISAARTLDVTDGTIECTGTTGYTVTLPSAALCPGRIYKIINTGTAVITITSVSNINGVQNKIISTQYAGFDVQSNGATYRIVGTF